MNKINDREFFAKAVGPVFELFFFLSEPKQTWNLLLPKKPKNWAAGALRKMAPAFLERGRVFEDWCWFGSETPQEDTGGTPVHCAFFSAFRARHLSEQYKTESQFFAQALRQVIVRPHTAQSLLGRNCLLPLNPDFMGLLIHWSS